MVFNQWELVQALAEACENAQPLLALPVLDAGYLYDYSRRDFGIMLLRIARTHPAYDWDCDVSDEQADVKWMDAKRPSACNFMKRRRRWMCAFDAGTGMYIDTLLAVGVHYPDAGAVSSEEVVPPIPEMVRHVATLESFNHPCQGEGP